MKYQVTIYASNGKYKPISTKINVGVGCDPKVIKAEGVKKICRKKLWTKADLLKYGYDTLKMRECEAED